MNEAQGNNAAGKRVLVVQCCDIPQWFYTCQQLKRLHPDWTIDGLGIDLPDVHFFVDYLRGFERVWYHPGELSEVYVHDLVVFPLMNRGYLRVKRSSWSLKGEKHWADYEGNLTPLTQGSLLKSALAPRCSPTEGFVDYLKDFPHRPLGEKTLLVESCHPSLVAKTEDDLGELLPNSSDITRISTGSLWRNWRQLRKKSFDGAVVYFSSEKGFVGLKLIPFLLRIPKILIFNENGNYFYSSPKQLLRFLFTRFRHGTHFAHEAPRILLFQTEACPYLEGAVDRLRRRSLFPQARITVVCRQEDSHRIESLEGVEEVITFGRKDGLREVLQLKKAIRKVNPDINCAVFTGRSVFRKQKLAFFLLGARRCFAFNARLDGYWLGASTLRRTWSREPLMFGLDEERGRKILLVQTEAVGYTREAVKRLQTEKLFPNAEILLVCRAEDREALRGCQGVKRLLAYRKGDRARHFVRLLKKIRAFRPEIKAAIFSGRPVFRAAKLLYFLAPCRLRLIFNAGLDGYWLSLKTLPRTLQHEPLLPGLVDGIGPAVLVFQTESAAYTAEAVRRIQEPRLYPDRRVMVVCRKLDQDQFTRLPGVAEVLTFAPKQSLADTWRLIRRVRRQRAEAKVGVFSGRPVFRDAKALFWLSRAHSRFAFNAQLNGYWLSLKTLPRTLQREPLLPGLVDGTGPAVLVFQTESAAYTAEAVRRIQEPRLYPDRRVIVVCRKLDQDQFTRLPGVAEVLTFAPKQSLADTWRLIRRVRRQRAEAKVGVFSGRRVFRGAKVLFWLSRAHSRFAFNAQLNGYWLTLRTIPRIYRREPLLPGYFDKSDLKSFVLLFQTEATPYVQAAVERIRSPKLYPASQIIVVCRTEDRSLLEKVPGVSQTIPFASRSSLAETWRLLRQLRKFKADAKVGVFSGRSVFRGAKLLFWLTKARRRFAFNAQLDGYWLGLTSIPRTFRREPLLFNLHHREIHHVLLLESESPDLMSSAIEILRQPHVVPRARVSLLCREDRVELFQRTSGVDRCVSYSKTSPWKNLLTISHLARSRPEVVSAIFSGRRVFLKQKFLFWILPAGSRLAFNEGLDCFYVNRKTFKQFMGSRAAKSSSTLEILGLGLVRGILFFPRFSYLIIWTAYMNWRRSRAAARRV